jgi:putative restriction endonuclease
MTDVSIAIAKTRGEHFEALTWFHRQAGKRISWTEIKAHVDQGARLVNQAKGIYKPAYGDYALSVRQTLNSPYADREIQRRPDGSWVYPYFQENPNPAERDREATNRGLMKCMEDGVPIGVMIQAKPKPGVEYDVLGLALVAEWENGYFILEGFAADGRANAPEVGSDAAHDRARAAAAFIDDFEPGGEDQRERQIAEVVRRQGQASFRQGLRDAYGDRCAITGCDAVGALEAAHISPYRGVQSNHPQNGLLLRADIHVLFDLGLITVDPATLTVVVAPQLRSGFYTELHGGALSAPSDPTARPSVDALAEHKEWAKI